MTVSTHVSLRDITKRYGGIHALKGASLGLAAGEIHALMGENGAGKSTLSRILAGIIRPDAGEMLIDGANIALGNPLDAQRRGIAIINQELDLFPHLSVGENLVIGNLRYVEHGIVSARRIETFCRPVLDQVGLACDTRTRTSDLSIAHRQLLAIARSLSMQARVLIMDEPTSALSDDASERLFALIGALKSKGVTIVYVSHKLNEIFRLSDRITVLRDGETIGKCVTAATDAQEIIRMMVGRPMVRSERRAVPPRSSVLLAVDRLSTRKLRQVSFDLRAGEILGVAGLVGAGRSALGAALAGLDKVHSGAMRLKQVVFAPKNPAQAMQAGLGFLPEDRKLQGLMMQMSVRENGTFAILPRIASAGVIREARETEALDRIVRRLALKSPSLETPVWALSGGNQQKALLARLLLAGPDVLFLDDPTRGIDVGAKEDIYRLIDELCVAGKGVILVSSELPELFRCSDRILVLNAGKVAATLDARDATQESVIAAATSTNGDLRRVS
jgi:ABC-type sugar transport system ATPase subunit